MKNLKQTVIFSISPLIIISSLLMVAQGQYDKNWTNDNTSRPALEAVEYSNLTDTASRDILVGLLSDAGVSEERQKVFFERVGQFNESVKKEWLTDGGFESAAPTYTKYDPYDMQDAWAAKYGSFPGYNCRITAFSLFSDFISTGDCASCSDGSDSLFMDLETLNSDTDVLCGDSTEKFRAIYAPIPAAASTDIKQQVRKFQEGWAARGIGFSYNTKARLISIVFQNKFSDTDNTLFIGHTGVLLPADDSTLYFIEKVAFQEPYRLLKFKDRTELSDYLMEKYDISWGQDDTARPFIMENNKLMDGYRPNPKMQLQ